MGRHDDGDDASTCDRRPSRPGVRLPARSPAGVRALAGLLGLVLVGAWLLVPAAAQPTRWTAPLLRAVLVPRGDWSGPALADDPALVLLDLARLALVAVSLRLALAVLAVAWAVGRPTARRQRLAVRLTPRLLRPALAGVLGTVTAVGAVGAPAVAAPAAITSTSLPTSATTGPGATGPGWSPTVDRQPDVGAADPGWVTPVPQLPTPDAAPRRAEHGAAEAAHVVVQRGDCLWSLAARHLGPGADATRVAREWPRWWEANRAVIGPDPDRLLPGTVLVVPAAAGRQ